MATAGIHNKGLMIPALILFGVIALSPFWLNLGKTADGPAIVLSEKAKAAKGCVRTKEYMTRRHMQLLDVWRSAAGRGGSSVYVNADGKRFTMSLSNTCLDCHDNKTEFCDRCHAYVSVTPHCWDCHIPDSGELP